MTVDRCSFLCSNVRMPDSLTYSTAPLRLHMDAVPFRENSNPWKVLEVSYIVAGHPTYRASRIARLAYAKARRPAWGTDLTARQKAQVERHGYGLGLDVFHARIITAGTLTATGFIVKPVSS